MHIYYNLHYNLHAQRVSRELCSQSLALTSLDASLQSF